MTATLSVNLWVKHLLTLQERVIKTSTVSTCPWPHPKCSFESAGNSRLSGPIRFRYRFEVVDTLNLVLACGSSPSPSLYLSLSKPPTFLQSTIGSFFHLITWANRVPLSLLCYFELSQAFYQVCFQRLKYLFVVLMAVSLRLPHYHSTPPSRSSSCIIPTPNSNQHSLSQSRCIWLRLCRFTEDSSSWWW